MYRKNLKSIFQVYEEVATLFKSHNDLLEEFTYFLPDSTTPAAGKKAAGFKGFRGKGGALAGQAGGASKRKGKGDKGQPEPAAPPQEEEKKSAVCLAKELALFEKIKTRLHNREAYNELIKCLNIFNAEVISKMELQGLVWDILGKYPDLHAGFSDFLARCESMDFETVEGGKGKDGKMSAKDIQKMKVMSAREKFLSKPISELDLSACERCGPSYRLLPNNFPVAVASARTPLCIEHLNDNWVSVTSGSEDYSFKAMRKNQYEEALFHCEDDRFEMDMILETTKSTIEALEPILEKLNGMTPEEASTYRVPEGTLSAIHLRAIERMYGIGTDQGNDIRRMILDYPGATAHVVMARLKQKDAEWRKVKVEVTPTWVDVYEKNYNKSLDHRSFYFKQTDKKALSAKGMTGEIKEMSDKKKTSEDAIGCGASGALGAHGISPDLTFKYADRKVHDDIYAVLKFSTSEMMNAEQAEKVMRTWREFLEPFFGISRADVEGDYVDDSAEQAALFVRKDEDEEEVDEEDGGVEDGDGANAGGDSEEKMDVDGSGGSAEEAAAAKVEGGEGSGEDAIIDVDMAEDAKQGGVDAGANAEGDEGDDSDGPGVKKRKAAAPKGPSRLGKKSKKGESPDVSEEDDEDDDEEDDEEERVYAACKPLSGIPAPAGVEGDEDTIVAEPLASLDRKIFYGHDAYYILFRLHQHLYERLSTARASAASMSQQFGQKALPEDVRATKEREIHNDFLRLLFKLLNGAVESSNFEDDCRTLLGANSYVLFTLDKLIYKIVKQIQALHADETAAKLLHLHEYESARSTAYVEGIYHANASVLIPEETCYRFGSIDGGESLTLQLMEPGLDRADLPSGIMEAQFHDYLEGFLQSAVEEEGEEDIAAKPWLDRSERPPVYLARSKAVAGLDDSAGGAVVVSGDSTRMGDVSVFNSLECKIACANSKVSYVLDTEDIFHRKPGTGAGAGKGRGAKSKGPVKSRAERTSARFRAWLAKKEAEMPKEDESKKAAKAKVDATRAAEDAEGAAAAAAALGAAAAEAEEVDAALEDDEAAGAGADADEESEDGAFHDAQGDGGDDVRGGSVVMDEDGGAGGASAEEWDDAAEGDGGAPDAGARDAEAVDATPAAMEVEDEEAGGDDVLDH